MSVSIPAAWLAAMAAMLIACTPARAGASVPSGDAAVALPFRVEGDIGPGCVEWRVRETGSDVELALAVGSRRIAGFDGNIARFGTHELAWCAPTPQHYSLMIDVPGNAPAARASAPRLSVRALGDDEGAASAAHALAEALADMADPQSSGASGAAFARAAALFDASGDDERAGSAWLYAAVRAEFALDRALAQSAFEAARAHAQRLHWTREEVVLLNDRALFLQASDTLHAKQLAEQAFALQAPLRDERLSALIENNLCLLQRQYGDLQAAEPCFARALATLLRLNSPPANIGATRNNLAVVAYNQGRYAAAAGELRIAADERRRGGDRRGYVLSIGNLALCLYQLGRLEEALRELHDAYAFAAGAGDDFGRAHSADYLAAMYLAWGDTTTATAFAAESEAVYRRAGLVADLAPALRLRAHIEADRGHLDDALASVREGWTLALTGDLRAAAANLAPVYADILLRRGDLTAAGAFIADAKTRFATHEKFNSLSLQAAELRWLRASGRRSDAEALAARLLEQVRYPGVLRTSILIERYLLAVDGAADCSGCVERYARLLDEITRDVAVAPDPQLALRLLDVVRPAAEATIALQLRGCTATPACGLSALQTARRFFALESAALKDTARDEAKDGELRGLLQSLSTLEARNDVSVAPAQLRARLARLQSAARLRRAAPVAPCRDCAADAANADVIYFFGASRGWRWQRAADGWSVRETMPWPRLASALEAFADSARRRAALVQLSELVAGLDDPAPGLAVGGDPRVSQIPFAALALGDGAPLLDRHAVRVRTSARARAASASADSAFWPAPASAAATLPMIESERAAVRTWSGRHDLAFGSSDDAARALKLLHISAHGARDLGSGSSVLWLADQPMLSFVFGPHPVADTVVINACESGAAPASEPVQASIAAGFLRAGAREVVATLFPVGDHAAARFSDVFYSNFDPVRDNLADAVRDAQRALRATPSAGDAWAAYVVLTAHD